MSVTIDWDKVRHVPASALQVGDTWVVPEAFTSFWAAPDDGVWRYPWQPPTGTAWTLLAREGNRVTARRDDGLERSEWMPVHTPVLHMEREQTGGGNA
ncbi:hypothetical protein AB0C10_37565 [Microbispora amethystogenes]|uniref:hypothetical protein n=1 Tax=Microbispora amethystogenes TaxID=1427754 RepID=UPI0033DAD5E5